MSAYLDASAPVPMLVTEPGSEVMDRFLTRYEGTLVVSEFAAAEVASAFSRLVRTNLMTAEEASARLTDFDSWRSIATVTAEIDASDVRLASVYVRRFDLKLRAPDALHIAVCRRLNLTLTTLDRRLGSAASALGVDMLDPSAQA